MSKKKIIIKEVPYNFITINVNDHNINITTDQDITDEYLQDMAKHIKSLEGKRKRKVVLTNIRGE